MISPIYVPSKNRVKGARTLQVLQEAELPYTLVVEPQDAEQYAAAYPLAVLAVLPENDRGLPYARNFILKRNSGWFWMLDDDIDGFYARSGTKLAKVSAAAALAASEGIIRAVPQAVQGALEYSQYAWSAKRNYALNSYCDVCVLIDAARTFFHAFQEEATLKLDREFTLQLLNAGHFTVRVQKYAFSCPKNGSNAGGLKPLYDTVQAERAAVDWMVSHYPGLVQAVVKSDGRYDAKINWSAFSARKLKALLG
jgi:hypothetical protein